MFHKIFHRMAANCLNLVTLSRGSEGNLLTDALKSTCLSGSLLAR